MPGTTSNSRPTRGDAIRWTDATVAYHTPSTPQPIFARSDQYNSLVERVQREQEAIQIRQAQERAEILETFSDGASAFSGAHTFRETIPKELKKEELKKRHLTKAERQAYHKPNPDWTMTGKGEVCRSTCALNVDDLVE